MQRRKFLKDSLFAGLSITIPNILLDASAETVKFGLITDLHQDIMHDAFQRLKAFTDEVGRQKPDIIAQLGDFAIPKEKNTEVITLFNKAHSTRLHVIGNHDTDEGFTKQQCLSTWEMPALYYVQEIKGIKVIVLDGNDKGSPTYKGGYPSYIGEEQINWLKEQLQKLSGPILVLSHQPLAGPVAIDNATHVQEILSKAKDKILLAINGHTHIDTLQTINGVTYLHLNSASYFWIGGQYKHDTYSTEVHKAHPLIASTCPYKNSLFAFMTIDRKKGVVTFSGRKGEWMGQTPNDLGFKTDLYKQEQEVVPFIRSFELKEKIH